MKSTDEDILYAVGDNLEKIKNSPALALVDQDKDVLLLDEKLDEFLIKMLKDYKDLTFKSINQEEEKENEEKDETLTKLAGFVKENTPEDVVDVRFTDKLADLPSMIKQRGEVSIEMEKTLKDQPQAMGIKADKVLEINKKTKAFDILKENMDKDEDKAKMIVNLLLDQARLMEGLEIDDPVAYTKNIWKLI